MSILTPSGITNLSTFVYKGTDESLIYKYITSNFASMLVHTFTPHWIAPNLITFSGFLLQVIALIIALIVVPEFSGLTTFSASCSAVCAALCLFGYSTLDNMDGKQARRTGTSTALGLLFDHGCDAFNAGLIGWAIIALHICYEGPSSWHTFILWFIPVFTFYLSTWEEYHVGEFYLPLINGPNEGIVFSIILLLATAFMSSSNFLWSEPPRNDFLIQFGTFVQPIICFLRQNLGGSNKTITTAPITLLDLTIIVSLLPVVGTFFHHNRRVFVSIMTRNKNQPIQHIFYAMSRQAPIFALIFSTALWLRCKPCRSIIHEHWFTFYSTAGCLFVDLIIRLMITHVLMQEFWLTSFTVIFRIILFSIPPIMYSFYPLLIDDHVALQLAKLGLLCAFLCASIFLCNFIHQAAFEISTALDIDIFSIERQLVRLNVTSQKRENSSETETLIVDPSFSKKKKSRRSSIKKQH